MLILIGFTHAVFCEESFHVFVNTKSLELLEGNKLKVKGGAFFKECSLLLGKLIREKIPR